MRDIENGRDRTWFFLGTHERNPVSSNFFGDYDLVLGLDVDLRAWSELDHRYDSEVRDISERDSLAELSFLSKRARERG